MTITATGDRLEVHQDHIADGSPNAMGAAQPEESSAAGVAEVPASARPSFTITDAAAACAVSRKTITRKLPELAGHGAAKDDDGVWRIPVEALLAVGLHPGRSVPGAATGAVRPAAPAPAPSPARTADQDTVTIPRDRWDDVRIRLARAEAEAAERGLALADARLALRALTAGPVTSARAASASAEVAAEPTGQAEVRLPADSSSVVATAADPEARPPQDAAVVGRDTVPVSVPAATPPLASGDSPAPPSPVEAADMVPADVVAARNLAARTGGYVPAGMAPVKKRRWWQSR